MKLLCINDSCQHIPPCVVFGEEYTPIKQETRSCGECFTLEETQTEGWDNWFWCSRFVEIGVGFDEKTQKIHSITV